MTHLVVLLASLVTDFTSYLDLKEYCPRACRTEECSPIETLCNLIDPDDLGWTVVPDKLVPISNTSLTCEEVPSLLSTFVNKTCDNLNVIGLDSSQIAQTKLYCPNACNLCVRGKCDDGVGADRLCAHLADQQETNPPFCATDAIKKYCPRACRTQDCTPIVPTLCDLDFPDDPRWTLYPPNTGENASDFSCAKIPTMISENCDDLSMIGFNETQINQTKLYCPKACKECPDTASAMTITSSPSTSPSQSPTTISTCRDDFDYNSKRYCIDIGHKNCNISSFLDKQFPETREKCLRSCTGCDPCEDAKPDDPGWRAVESKSTLTCSIAQALAKDCDSIVTSFADDLYDQNFLLEQLMRYCPETCGLCGQVNFPSDVKTLTPTATPTASPTVVPTVSLTKRPTSSPTQDPCVDVQEELTSFFSSSLYCSTVGKPETAFSLQEMIEIDTYGSSCTSVAKIFAADYPMLSLKNLEEKCPKTCNACEPFFFPLGM